MPTRLGKFTPPPPCAHTVVVVVVDVVLLLSYFDVGALMVVLGGMPCSVHPSIVPIVCVHVLVCVCVLRRRSLRTAVFYVACLSTLVQQPKTVLGSTCKRFWRFRLCTCVLFCVCWTRCIQSQGENVFVLLSSRVRGGYVEVFANEAVAAMIMHTKACAVNLLPS
jgi:hypothetical protein